MKGKVLYLNSWLDCPDDQLRANYKLQEKIHYAKSIFFYRLREQGVNNYQAMLCYDRWVHSNRDRIKLEGHERNNDVDTDPDDDLPPAS
jgi:hypothetical protein